MLSISILQHNLRSIDLTEFHLESCGLFICVFPSGGDFISFLRVTLDDITFSVCVHPSLSVFMRHRSTSLSSVVSSGWRLGCSALSSLGVVLVFVPSFHQGWFYSLTACLEAINSKLCFKLVLSVHISLRLC